MTAPPSLRQLQESVWRVISAPEDVPTTLANLRRTGDRLPDLVNEWIEGDAKASAEARLDLYANTYFFRLKEALEGDFPRTAEALGEARWHNLVTAYLQAHPSTRPSIRWAGEALPAFLAAHGVSEGERWIADLARVEWAESDAWQAGDAPEISLEDLAGVAPERWPFLRFVPSPHARIVEVEGDERLWRALDLAGTEEGESSEIQDYRPDPVCVFRGGMARGDGLVEVLLSGGTFGEACEALGGDEAETEEAAARAARHLAAWASRGLFSAIADSEG